MLRKPVLKKTKQIDYDLSRYDFLDLGCKTGGSIKLCAKRFRMGKDEKSYAKGIGIDYDAENVDNAREAGFDVIQQDILKLEIESKFKFVTALDFLEHMSGITGAEKVVKKMSELASDFLFIRHPSFEDIEYLKELGLKITWTDWEGHTAPIKISEFTEMFHRLGLRQYCFVFRGDLVDSSNKFIVPLNAPAELHEYSTKLGKKKHIKFDKKVYSMIDIFIPLKPIEPKIWNWITRED